MYIYNTYYYCYYHCYYFYILIYAYYIYIYIYIYMWIHIYIYINIISIGRSCGSNVKETDVKLQIFLNYEITKAFLFI